MKRYFFALLVLCCAVNYASAQDEASPKTAISIGAELGFPSRSVYNIGYSASAKFELPVHSRFGISATAGYSTFNFKSGLIGGQGTLSPDTFVPLKAGLLYYGSGDFFLELEAGAVLPQSGRNELTRNLFTYSFGPSLMFRINDDERQRINVGLRYEKWSRNTLQQIAIRAAYRFGW